MLSRYPVISKSGQEYLVQISKSNNLYYGEYYRAELFVKQQRKTIFGKVKERFVEVYSNCANMEDFEELYNSYVIMAIKTVEMYESKLIKEEQERVRKLKSEQQMKAEFEAWSGQCE